MLWAHLGVCESAILQNLKHHVEDVGVSLLNLIKEHDGVRPPSHCLCELPALVVADIACIVALHQSTCMCLLGAES